MASTVSTKWGPKEALGTANPAYPYIDFTWDTSHEVLTSPLFDFPIRGNVITFMINTEAVDTSTSATMTFILLGAANPKGTFANIYAPTAIANAALDSLTPELRYDFDVSTTTSYPYMKISMDPSANIASSTPIRVGILTGEKI
jgi:hypothetical protein